MRALSMFCIALALGLSAQESKASSPTLSGGISHSCSVEAGRVECWGDNSYGQLGDGTTTRSLAPKAVPGITTAIQVATGFFHTCALLQDGSVLCWGLNDSGHLGLGFKSAMEPNPQPVLLDGPIIAITAGGQHACALNMVGDMYCWGYNNQGQLGAGFASPSEPTPVSVPGTFDSLSAGHFHTCGLKQGVAYCWGLNNNGQTGIGSAGGNVLIPTPVAGGETFVEISGGYEHTCAVSTDMKAFCWGSNGAGELGAGVIGADSAFPVSVAGLGEVSDITAGAELACALTSAGTVECWGSTSWGKLGIGSLGATEHQQQSAYELISTPVAQLSGVTALGSTRGLHVCTRTPAGRHCWGDNGAGQVGQGLAPEDNSVATKVTGAAETAALSSQDYHTCALSDSGTVSCWGVNDAGQLGQSHTRNLPAPVNVAGIGVVQALAVGHVHTCALNGAGEVYCWGANGFGQLGVGDSEPYLGPQKVLGVASDVVGISAGRAHTCALHSDRHISCWGANSYGQLGNGLTTDSSSPVDVDSNETFNKVVLGAFHSCALTVSGSVMCWGSNVDGQLGEGDFLPVYAESPVAVVNGSGASQLVAGRFHTCLLVPGQFGVGIVKCWGSDAAGQLGNGPATSASMPAPVTSYSGFVSEVFAGGAGACLRQPNSTVTCWGDSSHLQLGTDSNVHSPTDVVALQGLTHLAIGSDHVCGVDTSGQAKCAGAAQFGQRGDGALGLVPYPVAVASDRLFANGFE